MNSTSRLSVARLTRSQSADFDLAYRLSAAVWIFDIDRKRIVQANDAACKLWRATCEDELRTRDFSIDMSKTVEKRLLQYQADFQNEDARFTELWTLYPNDEPEGVMVIFSGYLLPDGRMAMQCEAIGSADTDPENVRSAEALLHTDVMITLFSQNGPALYLNPAARTAFGQSIDAFPDVFTENADCTTLMTHILDTGEHRQVSKMNTALGTRWFDVTAKRCLDAATGQPAILMTAIDVTELKEARDTARNLADRDQLTTLHNRTYLQNHLAKLPDLSDDLDCAIIFFDVDRFKLINDRFGHEAGDTVLKHIALRTRAALRSQDMVARLGGDEFVVLIEGVPSQEDLEEQIERLRRAISKSVSHEMTRINCTISVGVAKFNTCTFRDGSRDISTVLREADIALYASKETGRDCVTFFTPAMGAAAKVRDQLEIEITRAIEKREFALHFQPRMDIRSGRIVAAEGLARWYHPDRGIVLPGTFIHICEETGLIQDLGVMVLEMGCEQAIAWQKAGRDITLSLNVSPRQFSEPSFLDTLTKLAKSPDFPVGKIELEVTENVLIGDPELIADRLKTITAMGYGVAIDDFGTGYSNLSYISRFPLTCLKIDRSFIAQLPESGPIVQLILTLGKQVGATVVSEGVETQEQLDWLKANNCEEAQGFLITGPLPIEHFDAFCTRKGHV